jgi:hypothetical protein
MSHIKELRDAARLLPMDAPARAGLLDLADAIQHCVRELSVSYSLDDIRKLNALCALSNRLIVTINNNPPGGGSMPVEEERLAA